jgi:hypothetical protein
MVLHVVHNSPLEYKKNEELFILSLAHYIHILSSWYECHCGVEHVTESC